MAQHPRKDPNPADSESREAAQTWDHSDSQPAGGSVTANDTARPRDREAQAGTEKVVPGFTTTGPSGSQGGRSLYGIAPDEEPDPMDS